MKSRKIGLLLILAMISITIGSRAEAKTNIDIAANRLIERYPETHILPSVGLGIFIGESGGGHNNGRYYGNMSRRIYDIEDSTDQFIDLMLKYGDVADQGSWIGQLYALQAHGYYGGASGYYIRYVSGIIESRGFTEHDDKARAYEEELIEGKRAENRKKRQVGMFTLAPGDNPIGTITADPKVLKKGSTVRIGYNYYTVEKTVAGLGNVILIGSLSSVRPGVKLDEVVEGAVG